LARLYLTPIIVIIHLDAKTKANLFKNDTKKALKACAFRADRIIMVVLKLPKFGP
jgi:hypothetical protein